MRKSGWGCGSMRNNYFSLWVFDFCSAMRFLFASTFLAISVIAIGYESARAERVRSYLETIPLEFLVISSVVISGDCKIAYVRDSNGYSHTVLEGDYVGQNYGMVVKIVQDGVHLVELHQGDDDKWFEKERFWPRGEEAVGLP